MILVTTYENWAIACRARGLEGPYALPDGSGYRFIGSTGTAATFKTAHPSRGVISDGAKP